MSDKPRKIFVAIIAQNDSTKNATSMMVVDGMLDALIQGWAFSIKSFPQKPQFHARNIAIAEFLASDCDDLFFLDDDVASGSGSMVKLLSHQVPMVAGAYPYRGDHELGFPVRWCTDTPFLFAVDPVTGDPSDTGLLKIEGTGAGFLRLSRRCVEMMVAHYNDARWYGAQEAPEGKCWLLFAFETIDRTLWSEDMTFFRLWREMGGTVWLDPSISFQHIGEKAFTGCLGDWLRDRAKPKFNVMLNQGKVAHERSEPKPNGNGQQAAYSPGEGGGQAGGQAGALHPGE